jgi:hypothetical protein
MIGSTLEANFHIIVGQTAAAKNIFKCVRKADLEVVDLILEPIASAEAVLSEEEKQLMSSYGLYTTKPITVAQEKELEDLDALLARVLLESGLSAFLPLDE